MKQLLTAIISLFLIIPFTQPSAEPMNNPHPQINMKTSYGEIILELDREKAPLSVDNFIKYVENNLYNGTIFHRVIKNFMIQGGGYSADYIQKTTFPPIKNEADNGLKNDRGTIAMARTSDPNSATSQFFINVVDNDFLNFSSPTMQGWGYTVFGKVVEGMDVVDKIRDIPTGRGGPFPRDVPTKTALIESVTVISDKTEQPPKEKK
jgi:peptidyl-prolyl cis-trans isomerase B (cyclophilin B)